MARIRATDYDAKYQSILDNAAALFAKESYPRATMLEIAEACGATKSMLYHYFDTKEDILFAILTEHLEHLIADIENVLARPEPIEQRFRRFVTAYVQKSAQSRQRHLSAMNDVKFLPVERQKPILGLEAKIVELIKKLLQELRPDLKEEHYKPYALLLLGILNWTDLWYKPTGTLKPQALCESISRLFLHGFLAERSKIAAFK